MSEDGIKQVNLRLLEDSRLGTIQKNGESDGPKNCNLCFKLNVLSFQMTEASESARKFNYTVSHLVIERCTGNHRANSSKAIEYSDCVSTDGPDPTTNDCPG